MNLSRSALRLVRVNGRQAETRPTKSLTVFSRLISCCECQVIRKGGNPMTTITTNDGTQIYFKDWGTGQPVVFSHGWPLSADAFEDQMMFLVDRGYRCIAHDRRGHGRSSQPWDGNDMDTYADDL